MTDHVPRAVVIGGSAGAIDALSILLPPLPADFPLPIFVAVHLPKDKSSRVASLFDSKCQMDVVEAEDKMPILPGTIYFAPPDYHLLIEAEGRIALSVDDPVNYSRPSIDVLFESAADAYDGRVLGIILTGANQDGAQGLKQICECGGRALVQRPDLAYAAAMPASALKSCPDAQAMTVEDIRGHLLTLKIS